MNYNYGTRCPEGLLQPNSIMIAYTVPLGQKVRHLNVSLLRAGSMELVCYRPPVGASTLVNGALLYNISIIAKSPKKRLTIYSGFYIRCLSCANPG